MSNKKEVKCFHYDQTPINKVETMANGALRLFATVANTGWLTYLNPDGSRREEYVSDNTLFDMEHLESIAGSVLTLNHPDEEVTPDNYNEHAKGSIGTKILTNPESGLVDVVMVVNARDAIDAINNGTKGVSMGYWATVAERQDGTFEQVKRICNHVAIVDRPRAEKAFMRIDSWTEQPSHEKQFQSQKQHCTGKIISVTL